MSANNKLSTLISKAALVRPKKTPAFVKVVWSVITTNPKLDKEYPRKIETYWRFQTEKLDATMEALPELAPRGEKIVMIISYHIAKEDKTLVEDYGITLPRKPKNEKIFNNLQKSLLEHDTDK